VTKIENKEYRISILIENHSYPQISSLFPIQFYFVSFLPMLIPSFPDSIALRFVHPLALVFSTRQR